MRAPFTAADDMFMSARSASNRRGKWSIGPWPRSAGSAKPDLAYYYGEYLHWRPMHPVNQPEGSLGRTQCCNLALRQWGDKRMTDDVFVKCLDRLWVGYGWLNMGRKRPIPHESYFAVAGYFFYFGNYYAALCINALHAPELHPATAATRLSAHRAGRKPTAVGGGGSAIFNYHQQYGTAFALMSLERCLPKPRDGY